MEISKTGRKRSVGNCQLVICGYYKLGNDVGKRKNGSDECQSLQNQAVNWLSVLDISCTSLSVDPLQKWTDSAWAVEKISMLHLSFVAS